MENKNKKEEYFWALLRISMGWIFLWSFLDKTFGWGLSTPANKAWLAGGSPTSGFLKLGTAGPFRDFFQGLAGNAFIDWLFMVGILLIGLVLFLGILIKLAGLFGSIMLFLMWLAHLPPDNNPFLNDHLIYLFILLGLSMADAGRYLGLGKWWADRKFVEKYPILK